MTNHLTLTDLRACALREWNSKVPNEQYLNLQSNKICPLWTPKSLVFVTPAKPPRASTFGKEIGVEFVEFPGPFIGS